MGRKRKPIEDRGPIGQFAGRLRTRQEQEEPGLTYREMGRRVHCSHSILAEAAGGQKFPTWERTELFVRACGADEAEVKRWHAKWEDTLRTLASMHRAISDSGVVTPIRTDAGPARAGRLRPFQPEVAEGDQWRPQPDQANTFDELSYQLRLLRIAAGDPSLRVLSGMMANGVDVPRKWVVYGPPSTLSEVLSGSRKPSFEMLRYLAHTLLRLAGENHAGPWTELQPWLDAWHRATFNQSRPDLTRHRRFGPVLLVTADQEIRPTPGVVAAMETPIAAATLAAMPEHIAAEIISGMPTSKAQAVLAAMHTLTSTNSTVADDTDTTDTTDSTKNDGGARAEGEDTDGSSPTNHAG